MNAVLDYLETHPNYGLYGLSTALCPTHDLRAIHSTASGDGVLHLSRMNNKYNDDDDINTDSTITILDDTLDVIGMAPSMAMKLDMDGAMALPITEETPVVISELLIGKLIVVSLYKQTYIIATKDDLHGSCPIHDGVNASTQELFLDLLDRIDPMGGLDGLFRANRGGINCRNFSYTFVMSPRSGKFTDRFLDYDLYLVALYDRANHMFKTPLQIASLCQQLNGASLSHKILLPNYKKLYSTGQLRTAFDRYTKRPYVRGVYLLDDEMNAAYVVAEKKDSKPNPERYLHRLVSRHLHQDYLGALQEQHFHPKFYTLVNTFISSYYNEAVKTYESLGHIRTNRTFHEKVAGCRTKLLLYALRNKRVNSITGLHKIFTPNKIIRMMIEEYGFERIDKLIEEQETERQRRTNV